MLIDLQEHVLDAFEPRFRDLRKRPRDIGPCANLCLEEVLYQRIRNTCAFQQQTLYPLEKVLLIRLHLGVCDKNVPDLVQLLL